MKIIIFFLSFLLIACSHSLKTVQQEELGIVIDLRTGQQLSPQSLVERVAKEPAILLGEIHDQYSHHKAQYWFLTQLIEKQPQGSLLLEMLSVDQQASLNNLTKKDMPLNKLADFIHWDHRWRWDWYGELLQQALLANYHLIATNLTKQEVNTIMLGAEPLRGKTSTSKEIKQQIADLIFANHSANCCSPELIQKMVEVQQFRDRRMAEKLWLSRQSTNVLIAGNHHVNRLFGVPVHLQELSGNQVKATVIMMSNEQQGIDAEQADFLWLIP
ncbi:putative iron-regulated protein [Volucribacter psittacicida]|uniref:Putative iron-regulated protein n=1 Tax=Volucribacter psittacicida TaxID=203482 RepID=A0A4R1G1Y5_9PAST|nr:ChaN family lipoprotein [Volucribacter psittacicida]TCK01684.1 putative iron-regulated protein [Volucribacter psittacicida]